MQFRALDPKNKQKTTNEGNLFRARRHRSRGLCLFTVGVPQATIEEARARGLLPPQECTKAWKVVQSCYAAQLSDAVLDWLINRGVITREQRGDAVAILHSISDCKLGGSDEERILNASEHDPDYGERPIDMAPPAISLADTQATSIATKD